MPPPRHVAIVMDGNGRWAERRGMPRGAGHQAGADAVHRVVRAARERGIAVLSLYAFSSDNWRRPRPEVAALLALFDHFLAAETATCVAQGIALTILGRRDRLPEHLLRSVERAERATAGGRAMRLRIAIDHSGRDAILAASRAAMGTTPGRDRFSDLVAAADHDLHPAVPVDLYIRTGGERRLSDFLLWEAAYAELLFLDVLWPDFTAADLDSALQDFHSRDRRFGGLPASLETPA
ncbi:MAG TPA: polyprenyl diphosphate synthase [Gemmatimonadales bacterium]|nr:polyprenyl diphosphate synthase [Gemmatimonadales bacterium]